MVIFETKKFNFLFVQLVALVIGLQYRKFLKAKPSNIMKRHIFNIVNGIFLSYFCFGYEIIHICIQSFVCFTALKLISRSYSHMYLFFTVLINNVNILTAFFSKICSYFCNDLFVQLTFIWSNKRLWEYNVWYYNSNDDNYSKVNKPGIVILWRPQVVRLFESWTKESSH